MLKRKLFLLMVWLCLAICAEAQTADSGVLVGVRDLQGYHTYWITHSPTQTLVTAKLPGIIVPHGNAFWRVGVISVCEFDGINNGGRDVVWESPLGKIPTVYQRAPCVKRGNVRTCGEISAQIWFVSPALISESYRQGQSEECEPRGGRWTTLAQVRKLGQADAVDIAEFVAGPAEGVFWHALEEAFAELQRGGMNCPPPTKEELNLANWSVTRVGGAWHPVADYSVGVGECELAGPLAAVMPRRVTADTVSDTLFTNAKQHASDLRDLFVSPTGARGLAVLEARSVQSLALYEIKDGQLGRKLLDLETNLPAGGNNVVSAQWALDAHVAEWTSTLTAASAQGNPKPRVVVDPKRVNDIFQQQE